MTGDVLVPCTCRVVTVRDPRNLMSHTSRTPSVNCPQHGIVPKPGPKP